MSGWLPLYPPSLESNEIPPEEVPANQPTTPNHVGGVEVSFSFSSEGDRQLVLSRGVEMGWEPLEGGQWGVEGGLGEGGGGGREGKGEETKLKDSDSSWKFSVKVVEVCVPMEAVTISLSEDPAPYMYCFLRYQFFDSGENLYIY